MKTTEAEKAEVPVIADVEETVRERLETIEEQENRIAVA
jgi:hypothetical protein